MQEATRRALNALNRTFYDRRGETFDATRDHPWPGWPRALAAALPDRMGVAEGDAETPAPPLRVLDLGCGNGRFAHFLMHRGLGPVEYLGLDSSEPLLESARKTLRRAPRDFFVQLAELDFVQGTVANDGRADDHRHTEDTGPESIPPGPFDLIVLFGVLHHVPGEDMRRRLVAALADRLAPGGALVLTAWQFGRDARFERTMLGATELAARAPELGFDPADLEPGDHLLGFGGDDSVPRFCHFVDEAELDRLWEGLPLVELARFRDDGRSADLNAYRVLARPVT
jgi:SAM-dependent methyltransferase